MTNDQAKLAIHKLFANDRNEITVIEAFELTGLGLEDLYSLPGVQVRHDFDNPLHTVLEFGHLNDYVFTVHEHIEYKVIVSAPTTHKAKELYNKGKCSESYDTQILNSKIIDIERRNENEI